MPATTAKPESALGPAPAARAADIERPRVLVVDDDERNLLAIETVLEDVGEIVIARSGEEALRHLLKGEFAVILLDVFMPGMDGYETAQIIRQREQTKRIPIVFLSAVNKEAEHLMRGYAMGAVDYVFKPVEPVVLRSKVAVFVDLFAKTREIERKARHEQALLDANLQANAELLKAEQELRRAEQRQAAIIQSLPLVLYLEPLGCDPRCPTFVSGDLEAITGFSHREVLEQPEIWADRLHPDDRPRVLLALGDRARTGRLSVEYRWRCADGNYKHFHDQAVLLRDHHGEPVEFAGTLTDVTDRRSLETQLVEAQKMDAIGKLTGGIAHDFNNLLAAVLGGIGLIERRAELPDEHRKVLAMTRRAADQGTELVRRLLAFARRQQLEPKAIDLRRLHRDVDQILSHTLGGLVQLEWQLPDQPWDVFADPAQLELALMNLIINARDACAGGGTILIRTTNCTLAAGADVALPAGDYIRMDVIDQGCGIAPDMLQKVLEPFVTTKELGKGTGLGLSMVYGFAKQSGGTLCLKSELAEGTTAELWLPRATVSAVAEHVHDAPVATEASGKMLRILLVDDHEDVRRTTAGMLEDLGHSVTEARDGHAALAVLKQRGPEIDLLITDYAMAQLSGTEVVAKARVSRPHLPALIMTGYADATEIGGRPNDVSVLAKPFDLHTLSEAAHAATRAPAP